MLLSLCWAVLATISSLILAEQSRIDGVYPGEEIEMDFSEKLDQELDFVLPFLSSKWPPNATIKPLGYVTWPLKNNQKCFENNSTARDLLKPRDVITFVDGTYHDRNTFHYTAAFYYWSDNYNVVLRSKLSALQPGTDISSAGFVSEEEVIFDSSDPTSSDVTFYQLVATLASYETDFLEEVVFYYNHTSEQVMLQVLAEDEREPVREGVKDQFFWKGFPDYQRRQPDASVPFTGAYFRKVNLHTDSDLGVHVWYLGQAWTDPGKLLLMSPVSRDVCSASPCFIEEYLQLGGRTVQSNGMDGLTDDGGVKEVVLDEWVLNSDIDPKGEDKGPSYLLAHVLQGDQGKLYSVCLLQIPLSGHQVICTQVSTTLSSMAPFISWVNSKSSPEQETKTSLTIGIHTRPTAQSQGTSPEQLETATFVVMLNFTKQTDGSYAFSLETDHSQTKLDGKDKLLETFRLFDTVNGDVPHVYESRAVFGPRVSRITFDGEEYFYEAVVPTRGSNFIYNTPIGESKYKRNLIFMSTSTSGMTIALDSAMCWSSYYKGAGGLSVRFGESAGNAGETDYEKILALPVFYTYNPQDPGTYRKDQMILEVGFLSTKLEIRARKPDGIDVAPPSGSKTRAVGGVMTIVEGNPSLLSLEWDSVVGPLSYLVVPGEIRNPLPSTSSRISFRRFSWMPLSYRYLSLSGLGSRTARLPWIQSKSQELGLLIKTGEELVDLAALIMFSCREMGWRTKKLSDSSTGWNDPTAELCKVCSLRLNLTVELKYTFTLDAKYIQLSTTSSSTHIAALILKSIDGRHSLVYLAVSRINGISVVSEETVVVSDQDPQLVAATFTSTQILLAAEQVVFLYLHNNNLTLLLSPLDRNSPDADSSISKRVSPLLMLTSFHATVFNPDSSSIEVDITAYSPMGRHEFFIEKKRGSVLQIASGTFRNAIIGSRWCPSGTVIKVCRTSKNLIILTESKHLVLEPNGGQPTRIYPSFQVFDMLCYDQERVLVLVKLETKTANSSKTNVYGFLELVDSDQIALSREYSAKFLPFSELDSQQDERGFQKEPGTLKLVQSVSTGLYFSIDSALCYFSLNSEPLIADFQADWSFQQKYEAGEYLLKHNLLNTLTGELVPIEQILSLKSISPDKNKMYFNRSGTLPAKIERLDKTYNNWSLGLSIENNPHFTGHLFTVKPEPLPGSDMQKARQFILKFTETPRFIGRNLFATNVANSPSPSCAGSISNGIWTACLKADYTVDLHSWSNSAENSNMTASTNLSNINIVPPKSTSSEDDWKKRVDQLALVDLWSRYHSKEFEAVSILFTTTNTDDLINPSDRLYSRTIWQLQINITKTSDGSQIVTYATKSLLQNLSLPIQPNSFSHSPHGFSRHLFASLQQTSRSSSLQVMASNCGNSPLIREEGTRYYTMFPLRNYSQVWVLFGKTTVSDVLYLRIFEIANQCSGESREIAVPFKGEGIRAAACVQSLSVEEKVHCVLAGVTSSYWVEIYALYDRDPIILKYTEYKGYRNVVPTQVLMYVNDKASLSSDTARRENFFILVGSRTIANITENELNDDDTQGYDSSVLLYFPRNDASGGYAHGGMGVFDFIRANLPEVCDFRVASTGEVTGKDKSFVLFVRRCGESGNWEVGERMKPVITGSKRPNYFDISSSPELVGRGLERSVAKATTKVTARVFGTSIISQIVLNPDPVQFDFLEEYGDWIIGLLLTILAIAVCYGIWVLRKRRIASKKRVLAKYENFERSDATKEDDTVSQAGSEYQGDLVSRTRTKRTQTATDLPSYVPKRNKRPEF